MTKSEDILRSAHRILRENYEGEDGFMRNPDAYQWSMGWLVMDHLAETEEPVYKEEIANGRKTRTLYGIPVAIAYDEPNALKLTKCVGVMRHEF